MYEYENVKRLVYNGGWFVPVCETCGRFVKADDTIAFNGLGELVEQPNATCAKCGRIQMIFEGFFGDPDVD